MKLQRALIFSAFAAVVAVAVFALAIWGSGGITTAQAQDAPQAPAGFRVTNGSHIGTAIFNWSASIAAGPQNYRVGWLAVDDYLANRENNAWVAKFGHEDVTALADYTVTGLQPGTDYYFIVGLWRDDGGISWSEWRRLRLHPAELDARDRTRIYVEEAIARYEKYGRDATVDYYRGPRSVEGERALMLLTGDDQTVLASVVYPHLILSNSFTRPGTPMGDLIAQATPEGYWVSGVPLLNPATGQQGRSVFLVIRHDGLIFGSGHFPTREEYAKDYVQQAIALYEREGRAAAIAFYNSQDSIVGEFYLFLMGADDLYLAHPIFPHLIGSDVKDLPNLDLAGNPLGEEIAKATEAGIWVDYRWPNPVTRVEELKSAWVVRHDGLIFATGYYTPDPDAAPPAWKDADPREYTVTYVNNAIARYEREGLEALQHYYNSVGSFEGQWYLFATDANDHYVLHPLLPDLIGTDIKDLPQKDSEGNDLGKTIAGATAGGEGIWVEYDWPHPFTLQEVPKVTYVARHEDGTLFASGYYPDTEDPRAYTQQYVADAIARYDREGREAAIAYYNSPESIDGQWSLIMVSASDGVILANGIFPNTVGRIMRYINEAGVTEAGKWFPPQPAENPLAPELNRLQNWAVLHDGIIFVSGYFFSE